MINLLSPLISDSMIIQRDFPFPLRAGKKFTAVFLGKTYEAKETDGKWLVTLDPVSAGGPFEMEISCDEGSFKIKDIYSGDLWLCSGQSNMELMMDRLRDDYG
ncbi:MAG: 9-O-acetylesterase, partial [Treponema sp.]|nr:9-O-acetylesterase [Treponema sp.]